MARQSPADILFMKNLLMFVLIDARGYVKFKIEKGVFPGFGSKHLSKSVELKRLSPETPNSVKGSLYLPHYWARFVHDGRRAMPFGPPEAKAYVWYLNRRDDPRLSATGGYPKRYAQVRKLTKAEFDRDKEAGKLVARRAVFKGVPPSPFFSNSPGGGMARYREDNGGPLIRDESRKHFLERMKSVLNIKGSIRVQID